MLTSTLAIAIVAQAGTVSVSKVKTNDALRVLNYAAAPTGSRFAASLENNSIRIIDASTGTTTMALVGHPQQVYALAFNRAGTTLASGDESGRIWLWNLKTGKKVKEFPRDKAHIRGIQALSFSPDGALLASTGKDDAIIVWNVAAGKQVKQILGAGANVASAAFSADGKRLVAASLGSGLRVYQAPNWALVATAEGHNKLGTNDVAANPMGTCVVSAGRDNAASVWSPAKPTRLGSLRGHQDWVMRCAVSPNGRLAATSSNDRKVIVWDTKSFKPIKTLEDQSGIGAPIVFTADGRFLISATVSDTLQINSVQPAQGAAPAVQPKRRRR